MLLSGRHVGHARQERQDYTNSSCRLHELARVRLICKNQNKFSSLGQAQLLLSRTRTKKNCAPSQTLGDVNRALFGIVGFGLFFEKLYHKRSLVMTACQFQLK